jgi:hypothetical protein
MVEVIKGHGDVIICMALVFTDGRMVDNTRDGILMIRNR